MCVSECVCVFEPSLLVVAIVAYTVVVFGHGCFGAKLLNFTYFTKIRTCVMWKCVCQNTRACVCVLC